MWTRKRATARGGGGCGRACLRQGRAKKPPELSRRGHSTLGTPALGLGRGTETRADWEVRSTAACPTATGWAAGAGFLQSGQESGNTPPKATDSRGIGTRVQGDMEAQGHGQAWAAKTAGCGGGHGDEGGSMGMKGGCHGHEGGVHGHEGGPWA